MVNNGPQFDWVDEEGETQDDEEGHALMHAVVVLFRMRVFNGHEQPCYQRATLEGVSNKIFP